VALPDVRFPSLAHRFVDLDPRWVLPSGIGSFDPNDITLVARDTPRRLDEEPGK